MMTSITKNNNKKEYLFFTLGIVAIFVIWFISSIVVDNELVIPSIKSVFISLKNLLIKGKTYKIISFTLIRIIISLTIGVIIGIIIGVISALYPWVHSFLSPFVKIMRALPIASIILIILIMFGMKGFNDITFSPMIVTILLIVPIIYEAVYKGILNIDKTLIDVALLDTNSKSELVFKSYIPLIRNEMSISLSQSIGLSFKSMVMAEYISQTHTSIGQSLLNAKTWLEYSDVFSWTIILIVLSILFETISRYIVKEK